MTELRRRLIEDMRLQGLAESTQQTYINAIVELSWHVHRHGQEGDARVGHSVPEAKAGVGCLCQANGTGCRHRAQLSGPICSSHRDLQFSHRVDRPRPSCFQISKIRRDIMENDVACGQRVYSKVPAARPAHGRAQGSLLWIVGSRKPGLAAPGSIGSGGCRWRLRSFVFASRRASASADQRVGFGGSVDPEEHVLSTMSNRGTGLRWVGASTIPCSSHIIPRSSRLIQANSSPGAVSLRACTSIGSSTTWNSPPSRATLPARPRVKARLD